MGPGVDVADRLTDRPVAMTIRYLGGSRPVSVTLLAVLVYLSVHLGVDFPLSHRLFLPSLALGSAPLGLLPDLTLADYSGCISWE